MVFFRKRNKVVPVEMMPMNHESMASIIMDEFQPTEGIVETFIKRKATMQDVEAVSEEIRKLAQNKETPEIFADKYLRVVNNEIIPIVLADELYRHQHLRENLPYFLDLREDQLEKMEVHLKKQQDPEYALLFLETLRGNTPWDTRKKHLKRLHHNGETLMTRVKTFFTRQNLLWTHLRNAFGDKLHDHIENKAVSIIEEHKLTEADRQHLSEEQQTRKLSDKEKLEAYEEGSKSEIMGGYVRSWVLRHKKVSDRIDGLKNNINSYQRKRDSI